MYPTYQPSTLGHTILALAFYIVSAGFILYSMVALYSLLRFGRSKVTAILVTVFYLIMATSLYAAAILKLNAIRF